MTYETYGEWGELLNYPQGSKAQASDSSSRPEAMHPRDWANKAASNAQIFLLNSPSVIEAELQRFLERHATCVPWGDDDGTHQGPHAYGNFLVTQPTVPGEHGDRNPDFMWVTTNSQLAAVRLIEIERSNKQWYTANLKDPVPTAELNQARFQLSQWDQNLSKTRHRADFEDKYDLTKIGSAPRSLSYQYRLLFGRREEFIPVGIHGTHAVRLAENRTFLARANESYATIDRIQNVPKENTATALTVRRQKSGRWKIVAVPPTFRSGPRTAITLALTDGLEAAIRDLGRNNVDGKPVASQDRIDYLLRRCGHWRTEYKKEITAGRGWNTPFVDTE